jgi:hypothetical protein
MQQAITTVAATSSDLTGRAASRARRAALSQGKSALPPQAERARIGERAAAAVLPVTTVSSAPLAPVVQSSSNSALTATGASVKMGLTGRALSMVRRRILSQGKQALKQWQMASERGTTVASAVPTLVQEIRSDAKSAYCSDGSCREVARALRAERAKNGRGNAPPSRPSGRVRSKQLLVYPPKVADSLTYERQKVTGVRIGRGANVTGDEPGATLPVTGTQYIGIESGYMPRFGGVKVGVARTAGGQVVTGTQVRSQVQITGDESNPALRITGESDQELADDLTPRPEKGIYTEFQFQRMHNPHGHSVFGTNLCRSLKTAGSRTREQPRHAAMELTEGGRIITGTAIGRSHRVTGDEPGACRRITGDQYLTPAAKQPLCTTSAQSVPKVGVSYTLSGARVSGTQVGQRLCAPGGITGTVEEGACVAVSGDEYVGAEQYKRLCGDVPPPVGGEKVKTAETWHRQRITGVEVEHNPKVTGDEPGVCAPITGTPYVGPEQYETYCGEDAIEKASYRVAPQYAQGTRVTGDTPLHVDRVTGTHRGAERAITGTPYYRVDVEEDEKVSVLERIKRRFSVRSPQREAQLRISTKAVQVKNAEVRITGAFAVGEGKVTGNQEFHFSPRAKGERAAHTRVTGEGRVEGPSITGSAWTENPKITGTEDYIAAERNPSERAGGRHSFASAGLFKGKGRHEEPRQIVTGMVGWSAKSAAKVTLSGGAQG